MITKEVNNISQQITSNMKLVTILPIMAVLAKKKFKSQPNLKQPTKAKRDRISSETVEEECTSQIPRLGGTFQPTNDGLSGRIELLDYPNTAKCRHVIKADDSCEAVKINYRDVAVETNLVGCDLDYFWFEANGLTPRRQCQYFGDGCYENEFSATYNSQIYDDETDYYFDDSYENYLGGSDEFVVNSNSFTFFFKSNDIWSRGHVIFDWECVEPTTTSNITNIVELANAVLDGSGALGFTASDGADYGCAGRGTFNSFSTTLGHHVDTADRAFYVWKKCVQCATGND